MTLPKFTPHPMLELRDGPISVKSLPVFKEKWTKNISGSKGGFLIVRVDSRVGEDLAIDDAYWRMYYAEVNIFGMLGGAKNILVRGASGVLSSTFNNFVSTPAEDPSAGPVVYRWSAEDGEIWDEIGVEAREMTFGVPAQPTFNTGESHPELLTLDLYVNGRVW